MGFTFLGFISLIFTLTFLLGIPQVQTFVAQKAAAYFSEKLGVTVTIDAVAIYIFNGKVKLKGLTVLDHHNDTLLSAGELSTRLDILDLTKKEIILGETTLSNALFRLHKYEGEKGMNLDYIIRQFKPKEPKPSTGEPFHFKIRRIALENVEFNYLDDTAPRLPAAFQPGNIRAVIERGEMQDFRIEKDSILFAVREIRAIEQSGSGMTHFETDFMICSTGMFFENMLLETPSGSYVNGDVRFRYDHWRSFGYFIDSVKFDTQITQAFVNLEDIGFYTDALSGIPVSFRMKGNVTGPVSALKARGLELGIGSDTRLNMNADVYGLPNINESFFDLKIQRLSAKAEDIAKLRLNADKSPISLPQEVYNLGLITYTGRLTGGITDFVTKGLLTTAVGNFNTDLRLSAPDINRFNQASYSGSVRTALFDPGKLLGQRAVLGTVSADLTIDGTGFDPKTMSAEIQGNISSIGLLNYQYSDITLKGRFEKMAFEGEVVSKDPNLGLDFKGLTDFSGKTPQFNFNADVSCVDLQKLGFWKKSLIIHQAKLNLNLAAGGLDDLKGTLFVDSLDFTAEGKDHFVNRISLAADSSDGKRTVQVGGSLLTANFSGDFTFIPLINNLIYNANEYFPSIKVPYDSVAARQSQLLYFDIDVIEMKPVWDIFSPKVFVSSGTKIEGKYFSEVRTAEVTVISDHLGYDKIKAADLDLTLSTSSADVDLNLSLSRFNASDSVWFDYIDVVSKAYNDSVDFIIDWKDDVYNITRGTIHFKTWLGNPGIYDLYFYDTRIFAKEKEWVLNDNAYIGYSENLLKAENFQLKSEFGGELILSGQACDTPDDKLNLTVRDFPMEYLRSFSSAIPKPGGKLSGVAGIYSIFDKPFLTADLRIDSLSLFDEHLGDFIFKSSYNNTEQSLTINGNLETAFGNSFECKNGKIYLQSKDQNFDMPFTFQKFSIKPAETFIAPILTNLSGFLHGNLLLKGTFTSPVLTGSAYIESGHVDVPYIGGSYNLRFVNNKKIRISRTYIDFGEIILEDENYEKATLVGSIKHNDFKGFELYCEVKGKNFQFFNPDEEMSPAFYGKAIGTGTVVIKGPFDMLDIYAGIRTEKGTRLFIPMTSGPSTASENSFVIFVNSRDTSQAKPESVERKAPSGIQLTVDAEINDNAEVQIIFDEYTGDVLRSVGNGNLRIEMNRLGDLAMFGDYEVIKGDYLFTLKNLVNKKLKLVQGGTIRWSGDPTLAKIDASASYSLRTSAAPIMEGTTSLVGNAESDVSKSRIPVDVIVKLSGQLLEPQIAFDIQFPTLDERTRAQLMQALSTEDEKNKQAFALLVLRQFISSGTGAGDAANVAGGNTLEVLSNQLSNWVSQLSDGLDLGVRYRNKDNTTSGQDEVELALSTKLFNDRVSIDGNFGVATSKSTTATQNNNIFDVNVEVKLTDDGKLRLRGFNRSNDQNIIQAFPYTQGVGISYQTSFDTWAELTTRKKKNKKKEAPTDSIPPKKEVPDARNTNKKIKTDVKPPANKN